MGSQSAAGRQMERFEATPFDHSSIESFVYSRGIKADHSVSIAFSLAALDMSAGDPAVS